eukprot:TRINITY_DN501_c0_g1_i1.p2 TRINITY_DN501_c0_g1~~TRINITY_DN501_c0_g1_i1.p2  ORF type:complete len:208 (+),score=47.83 TRINITY_DN501_c0_g1_i1:66-689(+)
MERARRAPRRLLALFASSALWWACVPPQSWLFVGPNGKVARRPSQTSRNIDVTGSTRVVERNQEDREYEESYVAKYWWQQPSYLSDTGYRGNLNWSKKAYQERGMVEVKFGMLERVLIDKLKAEKGMTIDEIRQKASVYEFVQGERQPKLAKKMQFLLQLRFLYQGRETELIDVQEEIDKAVANPSRSYSGEPGADIFLDLDWPGFR